MKLGFVVAAYVLLGLACTQVLEASGKPARRANRPEMGGQWWRELFRDVTPQKVADGRLDPETLNNRIVGQAVRNWLRHRNLDDSAARQERLSKVGGTGSISGWLFEADGTTPIQQPVLVEAYDEWGFRAGGDFVWSENRYEINGLEAGNYYVRVTSEYYVDEFYDDARDVRHAALVEVREGQATQNINFALEPTGGGVGGVAGKVTDDTGQPAGEGWAVVALSLDRDFLGVDEVADDGSYLLSGLPAEGCKLWCAYEGLEEPRYAIQWYLDKTRWSQADTVRLIPGDTLRNVNFVLRPGGTIAGTVRKPNGQPLGEYECFLDVWDADRFQIRIGSTQSQGRFRLSGSPAGDFRIRFNYGGPDHTLMGGWYDGAGDFESATPVRVYFGDTTRIEIVLLQAATFTGTVLGPGNQPLAWEAEVMAYDEDFDWAGSSQTNERGTYTIGPLRPGRYALYAGFQGFTATNPLETPAGEWYPGVYDREAAQFLELQAGENMRVDFVLEAGGAIEGLVTDPDGNLVSYSGTVQAFDERGEPIREGRNANGGIYVVTGLPPGRYKLFFQYEGEKGLASEYYDGQMRLATAAWVLVRAGRWKSGVNFTLERPATVSGWLFGPGDVRLYSDQLFAVVYLVDGSSGLVLRSEMANLIGGYRLRVLSGDYKLAACTGYRNDLPQYDSIAVSFYPEGVSFDDPRAQTLFVGQGADMRLGGWVLTKAQGVISGTVYDREHDMPFREGSYFVFAYDTHGHLVKFSAYYSDAGPISGRYRLVGLHPGTYYVLAFGAGPREELVSTPAVWYGGVPEPLDVSDLELAGSPIPQAAVPVEVGEGEVRGIDIHLNAASRVVERGSSAVPKRFEMLPAYPNPFNASNTVAFLLPRRTRVTLELFDIWGRRVRTIMDEVREAGTHVVR